MTAHVPSASALLALIPLLPIPFAVYLSGLAFSPRGLIHSHEILPLFFAVLAPPPGAPAIASRFVQAAVLHRLSWTALPFAWTFTFILCLIRALVGFIFTRAVGWAAPEWFSHHSLYEPLAGLGPGVYAYLTIVDNDLPGYVPPLLAAACCWLENAPWTYGTSILAAISAKLLLLVRDTALERWRTGAGGSSSPGMAGSAASRPRLGDVELPTPAIQRGEKTPLAEAYPTSKPKPRVPPSTRYGLLPLLATLPYFLIPAIRLPFPADASLEVLMLSFPRPLQVNLAATMINATVNSLVPHLSPPHITMSAFTHSAQHEALHLVSASHPDIVFHTDADSHIDDMDGHYLHLAEAFRWASEARKAEWFMLVEDDFPVCSNGWDVIETAMSILESRRIEGSVGAGFIGTGGSGIIIHRSYLPLLSLLLRQYSALETPLPAAIRRRAPDQVIQDCIVGRKGSLCEREQNKGRAIISSRIVLDHIGGMATTTRDKALNSDKWRCGWRHAFHGDEAVDVVVV